MKSARLAVLIAGLGAICMSPEPGAAGGGPTTTPQGATSGAKAMTAADAAKQVKRPVTTREKAGTDGEGKAVYKDVTKHVAVAASEVLDFKDYGSHVVVVTKDGKKFSSAEE
jgi:hypothetical protein